MSEPAADPRERTILLMAIGTLFLIVVMAGVSVMTLLTILFPPPIPEGAAPGPTGADAAATADPNGGSGDTVSSGATQDEGMQGEGTQGEGTQGEAAPSGAAESSAAPREPGSANEAPEVPIGSVSSNADPRLSAPGGLADSNSAPRL